MKLRRLTMENFGPYVGKHEIDLDVPSSTPVILVHGENGRGKTSIYNAIRWCLYQTTTDRQGRERSTHSLMSYDALDIGEYFMGVTLEFEHDGDEYQLERHVQAARRPASDAALTFQTSLRQDGHFVPGEEIADRIANILHPSIARFFLFDAEMLSQYEALVDEPGRDTELVRNSIERILGLPALQLMQADLRTLRTAAEAKQLTTVKATKRHDSLVAKIQQSQDALAAIDGDLQSLQDLAQQAEAERSAVSDELRQFIDVQADVRELESVEEQERQEVEAEKRALEQVKVMLAAGWWAPMVAPVRERLAAARAAIAAATANIQADATDRFLIHLLEHAAEHDRCDICEQAIAGPTRGKLVSRLEELHARLKTANDQHQALAGGVKAQDALQAFDDADLLSRLRQGEVDVRRSRLRQHTLANRGDELRRRLRDHPKAEISSLEHRLNLAGERIRTLQAKTAERRLDRAQQASELQGLQKELQKLPGADPRTSTEFAIYSALDGVFEEALSDFRSQLRIDVQDEASAIFRELRTEQGYAGLRINDQFGLQVVDLNDRVIGEISAGYSQIVALSLVGALNRCATRVGPVVMDTPFGRLDVGHRERILRFIPSLAHQVILLVQSGELDRDRDLRYLAGKVGRELTIQRVSHQSSRIEATGVEA